MYRNTYTHLQTEYNMPSVHAHRGITKVSLSGSTHDNTVHAHCVLTLKSDADINFNEHTVCHSFKSLKFPF